MPSIIPSPGAPPGSPNVASTIELSADYSVADGTILYADAIAVLFRTAGLQFPYYSLVNTGTLWNRTANGASVVDTYNFGSIRNSGLIVAEATSGSARAISVGSAFGGLTNSGQIFALATGGLASGIEIWAGSGIDIVNSGLIAARSDHEAWAISRYNGGRVVNDATGSILAEGANAIAIFLGRGHLTPPGQPELADIDNAGRIEAVSTDPSEASVAIFLEGLEHETMTVVNSGVIRGDYAIFSSGYGFSPPQKNDDTIINRGAGLIEGIISLEMGDDRIVNEGTIQGYVDLFDGEDVFDNSLGTLIGAANLGWGDDRFVGGVHSDAVMGERDDDELYGNGGDDLLIGGRGNDLLVGGAGNDALFGEFGDDIIVTFGSDRARAGPGDDRVQLGDYTFTSAHGEAGRDVLVLPDTAKLLDLAAALGTARLSGFESIVLPGAQGLVIRPQDIALMTGGGSLLTVSASAAGTIHLVGSWSIGALQEIGGVQYRLYASGANQVLVQDGAGVAVLASAPAGATGLDSPTGNAPPAPGSVPGTYLEGSNFVASNYALNADLTIDADEHWVSEGGAAIFAASDPFVRFVNNGTLVSEGGADGAAGIRLTYLNNFRNEGSITVSAQGNGSSLASNLSTLATYGIDNAARNLIGNVYGIYQGGGLVPLLNGGSISASSEASVAGAYVNWGMDLVNEGDISASSSSFVAVGVYAANGGLLVNRGTISANGSVAAYGVRSSTHVVTIENHGLIAATAQQAGAEAIALSFYYQLGNATVLNVGTIRGDIAIQSSWMVNGGGLRLVNTGLIDGRIVLNVNPNGGPARTDIISNEGIINGEVRLGGERDIYLGTAGQQSGAVLGEGGSDILFGTVGADTLSGGDDGDYLIGGGGADTLTGGAGGDRFVYRSSAESTGSAFDTIADFQTGLDAIDLSALGVTSWSFTPGGGFTTLIAATASGAFELRIVGTVAASDLILASVPTVNGTAAADLIAATAAGSTLDGGEGDDLLVGAAGNDRLIGGGGLDVYWGGAGDDVYIVESGDDQIFEVSGAGIDSVEFSGWHPSLSYTLADNVENLLLVVGGMGTGNALDNVIIGNADPNILDGAAGADRLIGGMGNDEYRVDNAGDVVVEAAGAGTDRVVASSSFTLGENLENLTLTGTGDLAGTGNWLGNRITGNDGANALSGGEGADWIEGGSGTDRLSGGVDSDQLYGDWGDDEIAGGEGDDLIEGGGHGDLLDGGAGDDHIYADTSPRWDPIGGNYRPPGTYDYLGVDVLIGGGGGDLIEAGVGADRITYLESADSTESSRDRIRSFQTGTDKIDLSAVGATSVSWSSMIDPADGASYNLVTVLTPAGTMKIRVDGAVALTDFILPVNAPIEGTEGDDQLSGTEGIDEIRGNGGHDLLEGLAADDLLEGGAGNDRLVGGLGADQLIGGLGDDTFVFDTVDSIVEDAGGGTDTVESAFTYTLPANVENLVLTGGSAIDGTGNDLVNAITGNGAANRLDGGLGADVMSGGGGSDTFVVDDVGDTIVESAGGGADTAESSVSYTIGSEVERLTLTGTASIDGTGNGLANIVTGNSGNNVLDGGVGSDLMIGGLGNDTFTVDNVGDSVSEQTGAGTDTVRSAINYTLGDWVENLELLAGALAGTGNGLANVITGNASANTLDGKGGADNMVGGLGDDLYIVDNVGDVLTEATSAGTDSVQSSVSFTLGANVENLVLLAGALNGTGNSLANSLSGNGANNTLNGMGGADAMAGGAGHDTYIVDNAGDVVVEGFNAGNDTVLASTTFTLGDNVEHLTLTGTGSISGTGNGLNNILNGNNAANFLNGMGGADFMTGGGGDDTYFVDNGSDKVTEAAGGGNDVVMSSVNWTLGAEVERLVLTGTAALHGTGNDLANIIMGNAAANRLDGGLGADTMQGGFGNDIYIVDNAGDVATDTDGVDTVLSSVSYTLHSTIDNLTLTGAAAINGTGNALWNVMIGNAASNTLDGGLGNDTLNGGAGADILIGGAGHDVYYVDDAGDQVIDTGGGNDHVVSSIDYVLGADLEYLTLAGSAVSATGNGKNNLIYGNAGNNVIDGAGGADFMVGGLGDDVYYIENGSDAVTEHAGQGNDTVMSRVNHALGGNVENLILIGANAVNATGNVLNNVLTGNSASNVLSGGLGADTMSGGGGNDAYLYRFVTESTAASRDRINGFNAGDKINLSLLDANTNTSATNDAFTFIGANAFHNVAGELRATESGGVWTIQADVNGDGIADLVIGLTTEGGYLIGAGDFLL